MNKTVRSLLNPFKWIRANRLARQDSGYDKSSSDMELSLYSKILKNDMLHYGYFENPEISTDEISISQLENAQIKYAENIIDQLPHPSGNILDVGCGMGGLSAMLKKKGHSVEAVTPNKRQVNYIKQKYPEIPVHQFRFEDFNSDKKFKTIINSESLQYINLKTAFAKVDSLTLPDSRWIIVDYFRLNDSGINKSAHLFEDFIKAVNESKWKIIYEKEITQNVLPTLRMINLYVERFILPVKEYGWNKLRYKKGWLYYLLDDLRDSVDKKFTKELASVDPEKFLREKKYVMFVLEKK
ncbi:MAG: SAM-dependent methyltransferase [Bacteroidia bacterium]